MRHLLAREELRRPQRFVALVVALAGGLGLLAACADEGGGTAPDAPPNILLVVLDDMGVDTVGAYGADVRTPTLDGLADRGVRFTNAWASPFCEPSRAAIQTGRYGFRTGIGSVGPGGGSHTE